MVLVDFKLGEGKSYMSKIRKKEGSIMIGIMFLVLLIIITFVFGYEVGLLLIAKDKNDSIAKNMSSSLILNIDKERIRQGIVDIDRFEGESIVRKIKEESYSKQSKIFDEPVVDISYSNNGPNEVEVIVTTELPLKNDLVFFKDISIKSRSRHRAYIETELGEIDTEMLAELPWDLIWELLVIEEVF